MAPPLAIMLSTAQLINEEQLDVDTGWRMILVGALSNLAFKGVLVAVLGRRRMAVRVAMPFAIALGGGVLLPVLWP